jgi:glucose/arabinose dehydrogenase
MPSDTSTHPDIIFIQRTGAIKYYEALTGNITTMGTVSNVSTATEDGLIGVAVEKPFKNRVYVSYAHQITSGAANTIISGSFRLSRFDLTAPGAKTLDMANEKVLLDVPSARNRWHTAGALAFDNAGNLYWAIGDNETTVTGPGNTHDLRGGILRIKPKDDGTYTSPAGNFGDYWANVFQGQGRTALAAAYRDTSKVRPEIYIKGTRNAYVMNVDPSNGQVVYSQCGPDYGGTTEAWNNTRTPAFTGWPFWAGGTNTASSQVGSGQYGKNGSSEPTTGTWNTYEPTDTLNPVNKWTANMAGAPTMGVDTLPPLARSKYYLNHNTANCAMGSVVIRYDGRVKNPGKLPPQMNNVWLNGNYGTHITYAAKVDTATGNPAVLGTGTGAWNQIWASFISGSSAATFQAMTDFKQGPDGAFYVNNYFCGSGTSANAASGTCGGIARIEYKGAACSDTALHPPGGITGILGGRVTRQSVDWLKVSANSFSVFVDGPHSIKILDMNGRTLVSMKGEGRKDYSMPSLPKSGLYYLEVKTQERGTAVQAFTRF